MTPRSTRVSATIVAVDITAHKEIRTITNIKKATKKSNQRIRYYIELLIGIKHANHTRMGFSGTFKALLRLHQAFEEIFDEAQRAHTTQRNQSEDLPTITPFPVHSRTSQMLVKIDPRHSESDETIRLRSEALFTYYTQLFNSEERELYLDYIQECAEIETAAKEQHVSQDNQLEDENFTRKARTFLKQLWNKQPTSHRSSIAEASAQSAALTVTGSSRKKAASLDVKLEFATPVQVYKSRSTRKLS